MSDHLFSVENKICIVTGGLGQIGKNFVQELWARGARVAVWGRTINNERIANTLGEKALNDSSLRFYSVDINKKETLEKALDDMEQAWGEAPDVLVNNAGITKDGLFMRMSEQVFREVVDVNLVGTFLACQAVGARMIKAGKGGSIINVGSIYGMLSPIQDIYAYKKERTGVPFIKPVAYSAAKSGIYNLTRYLATYWGKKNIRVNTLTPAGVWRDTQDETFQANFCARMPMGRMSQENEYNGALIFLASQASSFMTGSNLVIDGGWTAW